MKRLLSQFTKRIAAFVPDEMRREDGTAAMEFVLVIPLIMMIFMASFESGLLMTRSIMLEQSVDMTMRELRLGHISPVTNRRLKKEICARTVIFPNCMNSMKIQLNRVSTSTWAIPAEPNHCINRREVAEPGRCREASATRPADSSLRTDHAGTAMSASPGRCARAR